MPKAKVSSKKIVHVAAVLEDIHMVHETSKIIDDRARGRAGSPIQARATTHSNIGVAIFESPKGARELRVTFAYRVEVDNPDGNARLFDYASEFHARFSVSEMAGIVVGEPVPVSAVATYLNQVAWLARARAQGTISAMGTAGINLPLSTTYEEPAAAAT